ncbi:hypothetical protein [Trinickia acidisoli]|uniref:hypothetical protein n=1 Tax=Trinickia acidisoli TaxID=2767482 RepID=UPI001A8DB08E
MGGNYSMSNSQVGDDQQSGMPAQSSIKQTIRAGLVGGLTGAMLIWVYEALVWVGVQHLMPLGGIPRNATGLVFGKDVQDALGIWAYLLGTAIHFVFALSWGVLFAVIWPYFRRRGYEATFVALFYAIVAWLVMHTLIMIASSNHPNYFDPNVVIGGFMSHFVFTVPLALVVKRMLAPR